MPAPTSMTPKQLLRLLGTPDAPVLIDICIDADFATDPRVLPTSRRHPFKQIADLAPALMGRKTVIICQKGKKLSQGAAAILRTYGINAQVLTGGIFAWRDAGAPLIPAAGLPERGTLWVTRHRPKIDRIACPWLIRRFIDPDADFLYVPPSEVMDVAEKFDAIPFDVQPADFSHHGEKCTFDALLDHFKLDLAALTKMADVIRAADGTPNADSPQAAGLLALSLGLSRMYKDDLAQLDAALPFYDALYRWARDASTESHDWEAHQ
jgi:rhodanese-related sulfurtransferase